ncbi:ArsR/SmtB family transcription factor, partial [Sphaerisporangium corydalis]
MSGKTGKTGRPRLRHARPDAFTALADPTRRHLLERLTAGERSVTELMADLKVTQAAVSQHLKVLRDAGLVEVRPDGRQRLYRLRPEGLTVPRDWLTDLEHLSHHHPTTLATAPYDPSPDPDRPRPHPDAESDHPGPPLDHP